MLNKKHKLLELKTNALVDSLYVWNYKTKHKWRGIEFVDYKEYNFGDNVTNIDFIKSNKEWKTLIKLYEEEKELSIYFIVDLNESFITKYNNKHTKKDILYEIIYILWLSAIKEWNKVWALVNKQKNKLFFSKKWKQNFINIINQIENDLSFFNNKTFIDKIKWVFKKNNNTNKSNILKYFNMLKIKNSMVFYLTDKLEFDLKDLKILSIKNDLVLCNIFNSFENNLGWNWIIWIQNNNLKIDLQNKQKVSKYQELRKNNIINLKKTILKYWWRYILFDENTNVFQEFYKLFK